MLRGQHFSSDAKAEVVVRKWISSQPETFFKDRMKKIDRTTEKMCSCKW
jgi:hypothetical protein